jgi:ribonuclease E
MRLLPRARTVRRAVVGLGLGAVAGWVWSLLQTPQRADAPAGSALAAPVPPPQAPAPAEIIDDAVAPEVGDVVALAVPAEDAGLAPEPLLAPDPGAPVTEAADAADPTGSNEPEAPTSVRKATIRARAKLAEATEALADEGTDRISATTPKPAKRAPRKATPAPDED